MQENARQARNAQRLTELHPEFARRVAAIIAELEAAGFRPRIQDAWRSPESQLAAFESGHSTLAYGFHNVTGPRGEKESLAVDLLDDDFPLNSRSNYLLRLAAAAAKQRCRSGVDWGLPPAMRAALEVAISAGDWGAPVKIGWDPTHIEPIDVTLEQARRQVRPQDFRAPQMRLRARKRKKPRKRKKSKKTKSRARRSASR